MCRAALWLKRAHPEWGAGLIRVLIQATWPEAKLPHVRTLQRWFRQAGVNQQLQGQKRVLQVSRGQAAHAVWVMDSKVRIRLKSGEQVQWLLASDEYSGAVLREVYPAIDGQSRLSAYPAFCANPCRYYPDQEECPWQLARVGHFLEQYRFDRRVDQVGRITLFSCDYTIGRAHRGKTVAVQFSQPDWVWVVRDERGTILKTLSVDVISQDNIVHFHLAKRTQGIFMPLLNGAILVSHDTGLVPTHNVLPQIQLYFVYANTRRSAPPTE